MTKELDSCVYVKESMDNMGLPGREARYYSIRPDQDLTDEITKTNNILNEVFSVGSPTSVFDELIPYPELIGQVHVDWDFINYGATELVYVLGLKYEGVANRYAVSIGQPSAEFGSVKREFDILNRLSTINPRHVVAPKLYFSNYDRELYISPYIDQARCIYGGHEDWGAFVPEPKYHFEAFDQEAQEVVCRNMIALLVHYYDQQNSTGIIDARLGGGDFILSKGWDLNGRSPETMLENMKMVAARNAIKIPYDEYLNFIRNEFTARDYYRGMGFLDSGSIINYKSEVGLKSEIIEAGIELGKRL